MVIGKIRYVYNNIILKFDDEAEFLKEIKDAINCMRIFSIEVVCFSKDISKKVDLIYMDEFGI